MAWRAVVSSARRVRQTQPHLWPSRDQVGVQGSVDPDDHGVHAVAAPGGAVRGLRGDAGQRGELPGCQVAHFACHAVTDPFDPARSVLLHDHEHGMLTVADLTAVHLRHARLAYLSACRTADADHDLPDEVPNLASAFHLSGFPDVVGTLWDVDDAIATTIATDFYRALSTQPTGFAATATALHTAIRATRDRYRRLSSVWAAHVHTGA
jgi:CHAT domain-containing protein